jgi:hypothetical protein
MCRAVSTRLWVVDTVSSTLVFHNHDLEEARKWTNFTPRIVPILALIPFGFGMVSVFMSCQTYVVDSFSQYAASAVAAISCVRSVVGTFLVGTQNPCYRSSQINAL